VRVTVAISLLAAATALVVLAVPTQSPLWLSVAAVASLLAGWAAARIVYTELVQSRRDAAADRAAQALAYRSMFAERASEHADFTTSMTDRLVRRDRDVAELEAAVVAAEQRAIEAETRVQREARRGDQAEEKLHELVALVEELEVQMAEREEQLAGSDASNLAVELDAVSALLAWEQKVVAAALPPESERKPA
jgi:hypothetical protein